MKSLLITFALISIVSFLTSCNLPKSYDPEIPDIKIDPKLEELFQELFTCDKNDSELSLEQFDPKEAIKVQDKIETMDLVYIDCDKKEKSKSHGSIRNLSKNITVTPPLSLKEKVNFVKIENLRTCSTQLIGAENDKSLEAKKTTIEIPNEPAIEVSELAVSQVGFSGKLKIQLSDSNSKFPTLFTNVHDQKNVIKISYYGKCIKYKENINTKDSDSMNCLEAELLAEKQLLVLVEVERPEVSGTQVKNICTK